MVQQIGGRADILGIDQSLIEMPLLDLLPELFGYEPILAAILAGHQAQLRLPEIGRDGPDGSIQHLNLLTLAHTSSAGQIDGLIQVISDVSERGIIEQVRVQQRNELRLLKEQITQQNIGLARMNAELRRATQLKDEFLANMSHEVRTPLTAVLGLAEILQAELVGPLNADQHDSLNGIQESGRHLLVLINDFLDIAKIEAGQFELDLRVVPVQSLCQSSVRMVKELAVRKSITLTLTIHPGLHLIRADERRLVQALINLLSNAIKFTPHSGQIGLDVQADSVRDQVRFTFWDTGIGIAVDDIQRLFKPFSQIDGEYQRQHVGSGLGLVLVAQLTKLHGGGVELTSEVGQGSRFTIALPWSHDDQQRQLEAMRNSQRQFPAADQQTDAVLPAIQTATPIDLLLVEDEQFSAAMLIDYLGRCGYRVTHVRSGEEALAQVREFAPHLIIMDVRLQGMDGLETMHHMRAKMALQNTPIIALTALAMPGDRERCLAAGANIYMSKPVTLRHLAEVTWGLIRK